MSVKDEAENRSDYETATTNNDQAAAPLYQKPVLRKYDQIEQVKPYGPSELEAG